MRETYFLMLLVAIYEAVLVGVRRSPLIINGLYKFFTLLLRSIFTEDSPVNRLYSLKTNYSLFWFGQKVVYNAHCDYF